MAKTMMYRDMEWKNCPFCGGLRLDVTEEKFFDEVKEKAGKAAVNVTCFDCRGEMWAFSYEAEENGFENVYEDMISYLNKKWNRRPGNKKK